MYIEIFVYIKSFVSLIILKHSIPYYIQMKILKNIKILFNLYKLFVLYYYYYYMSLHISYACTFFVKFFIFILLASLLLQLFRFTFTFSHLADAFIQSDLQLGNK